jgi:hypothetical protein
MIQERRRHRSDSRREALTLSLCAAARKAGIAGVVLCDKKGALIAGSFKGPAAQLLAAAGAALTATGEVPDVYGPRLRTRMVAKRLRNRQGVLCLCAAGAPDDCDMALRVASAGVGRILRTVR